jgi:hypothetical protein
LIAALQSGGGAAIVAPFNRLIFAHDVFSKLLVMHRNPTWLVDVSIASACRAAGRYRRQ